MARPRKPHTYLLLQYHRSDKVEMFNFQNSDGQSLSLAIEHTLEYGEPKLSVFFYLVWARGKINAVCSDERLSELELSLAQSVNNTIETVEFINEDGGLDFQITRSSLDKLELKNGFDS